MPLVRRTLLAALSGLALMPVHARDDPGGGREKGPKDDKGSKNHQGEKDHRGGKDHKDHQGDKPGRAHAFGKGHDRIPPGHRPGPGECRLWYPDRPPGHQPPPYRCGAPVPVGAWVLQGQAGGAVIEAVVYDARRPGVVVDVGLFDASSGAFLRVQGQLR